MVSNALSLDYNFNFLNRILILLIPSSYPILSSQGWVVPVPDPKCPEKFLGYSKKSYPGPLGRWSDMLTTTPLKWSSNYSTVTPVLKYARTITYGTTMESVQRTSLSSSEFCPRAGPSLQIQAPSLQFCPKAGLPLQTQEPRLQFY